eukprot:7624903-Pyramimonas_sp.AAC.1
MDWRLGGHGAPWTPQKLPRQLRKPIQAAKMAQDASMTGQDGFQTAQEASKTPQDASKSSPESAPRGNNH